MSRVIAYLRSHVKPLGALAFLAWTALRPAFVPGQHWTLTQWLSAGIVVGGALAAYVQKNSTDGIAGRAKEIWLVLAAGAGTLVQVLPDGLSRADLVTIASAVLMAGWSLIDGDTPQYPPSVGAHVETPYDGDVAEGELQSVFFALGSLAFLLYIVATAHNHLH